MTFRNTSSLSGRLALTTLSIAALSLASTLTAHADITLYSNGDATGGATFTTTTGGALTATDVLYLNSSTNKALYTSSTLGAVELGAPGLADKDPYPTDTSNLTDGDAYIGPVKGTTYNPTASNGSAQYGGYNTVAQTGEYQYSFTFGGDFTSLTGSVFTDNGLLAVYLDGMSLSLSSISNGGSTDNTFSTGTFGGVSATAPHTLQFITYNYNGASAIDFTASGTTATPEPGMWVTGASMLSMTGLGLVRGRRRAKRTTCAAAA